MPDADAEPNTLDPVVRGVFEAFTLAGSAADVCCFPMLRSIGLTAARRQENLF